METVLNTSAVNGHIEGNDGFMVGISGFSDVITTRHEGEPIGFRSHTARRGDFFMTRSAKGANHYE